MAVGKPDAAGPSDAAGDAAAPPCVTVTAVSPAVLLGLPVGQRLRLRGDVTRVPPPANLMWTWAVTNDIGQRVPAAAIDMTALRSTVEITLDRPGRYDILASVAPLCSGTAVATAVDPRIVPTSFWVRVVPPPGSPLTMLETTTAVLAGRPVAQDLQMVAGEPVAIDPHKALGAQGTLPVAVPSYIRISSARSSLRLEGYNGRAPYRAPLSALVSYDVLLIPYEPIAPALFGDVTPTQIGALSFSLDDGVLVTGRVSNALGAVAGARVLLRSGPLPSTLGLSAVDGTFSVRARGDGLEVLVMPPAGSGLPEAHVAGSPGFATGDPAPARVALDFRWRALATATLDVVVRTNEGAPPSRPVQVRLETVAGALPDVGTLTVDTARTFVASGFLRADGVTNAGGLAVFSGVPRASYRVTLVPIDDAAGDALTAATIDLGSEPAAVRTVRLRRKVKLSGRLGPPARSAGVTVVAVDTGADVAGPRLGGTADAEGRYELSVDPERVYRVFVEPVPARSLPRTPLGRVTVLDRDTALADRMLAQPLPMTGAVKYLGTGVAGAAIQVFCVGAAPDCVDPAAPTTDLARPLAETTSGADGAYVLSLPEPGTGF